MTMPQQQHLAYEAAKRAWIAANPGATPDELNQILDHDLGGSMVRDYLKKSKGEA